MGKLTLFVFLAVAALPSLTFAGSQAYSGSGTYYFTVPAHTYIQAQVWGAGGGGGGPSAGATGGTSSFNGWITAYGGGGASGNTPGVGGMYSGGSTYAQGASGSTGSGPYDLVLYGGNGGAGAYGAAGGAGSTGYNFNGSPGGLPGGGGGGGVRGAGGGGGGYSQYYWNGGLMAAGTVLTITVGAGGAGGAGIDADTGLYYSAGAGGNGYVLITWGDVPAATCSISLDTTTIAYGSGTYLRWSTTNANQWVYISNIGYVSTSGAVWVAPGTSTTYTCTAQGTGGWGSASATLYVTPPPAPTCSVWSDTTPTQYGNSTTLRWTSANATSFSISGVGSVTPNTTGSAVISPTTNTAYNGSVSGAGGSASCAYTQYVSPPPPSGLTYSCNAAADRITISWNASAGATFYAPRINPPGASNCSSFGWQMFSDGYTCLPNPDQWNATAINSFPISPNTGYSFWVHSYSPTGGYSGATSQVMSCAPTVPTCSVSAVTNPLSYGNSTTLSWSSLNSTSFYINSIGYVTPNTPGSTTVGPLATTNYNGSVSGAGGSAACNYTLTVNPPANCTFNGSTVNHGSSVTAYQAATVPAGSSCVSQMRTCTNGVLSGTYAFASCVVGPSCTLSVNPTTVLLGNSSTLTWSSTNATSCTGTNFSTGNAVSGAVSVAPIQSTTYTASCTGAGGTAQCTGTGAGGIGTLLTVTCTQSWSCTGAGNQTITQTNSDCSITNLTTCVAPQFCATGSSSCLIAAVTGSLSASPRLVPSGNTTRVTWSSVNASACTVSGNGNTWTGTSGSQISNSITEFTTYTMTCDDADADAVQDDFSDTVEITMVPSWVEL